jgi:hypothetical protein
MSTNAARYTRTHKHIVQTNNYATEPLFSAAELADNLSTATPMESPRRYSNDVIVVNAFGHVARKPRVMRVHFTIRHGIACKVFDFA